MDSIEKRNWLMHRRPIELETKPYGGWTLFIAKVEGHRIVQHSSREDYDGWVGKMRPLCLARFVAGRPRLHPATVLIVSGKYRLARIPSELWYGYDAVEVLDLLEVTLLSAKVRAIYPAWPDALLRIVPRDGREVEPRARPETCPGGPQAGRLTTAGFAQDAGSSAGAFTKQRQPIVVVCA